MKKIIALPIIAAIFVVSCTSKSNTATATKTVAESPTTSGSKKLTPEMLAEGKTIYENACKKCHDLPNPAKYTDEKWVKIMNWMGPKAKLTNPQSELVYDYVTTQN